MQKFFQNINKKRLCILLSLIWIVGILYFNFGKISQDYKRTLPEQNEWNRVRLESEFSDCLEQHGTNAYAHRIKYRESCLQEAEKTCNGAVWCMDTEHSNAFHFCMKAKIPECRKFTYFPNSSVSLKWYLSSSFSDPFKETVFLIFLVPFLMAISPFIGRRTIKWLTNTDRKKS